MTALFSKIRPAVWLWAGVAFTLLYALYSDGMYHPDEKFQILEFAHMKLFGRESTDLPWEYAVQMRCGVQPLLAYGVGRLLLVTGLYSPWVFTGVLRLLSALLSVGTVWALCAVLCRSSNMSTQHATRGMEAVDAGWLRGDAQRSIFLVLSLFLCCMAYVHVRFSSETWAGNLLALTLCCVLVYTQRRRAWWWGLAVGVLGGAAFLFRFQSGFALLGLGVWGILFVRDGRFLTATLCGLCAALAAGYAADTWLYGESCFTPWNYLRENLIYDRISTFGSDPWYYYLKSVTAEGLVLFGVLALAAVALFCWRWRWHPVTWMVLPFVLFHQMVGHKEARFLFPLLPLVPYMCVVAFCELPLRVRRSALWPVVGWTAVVMSLSVTLYNLMLSNADICFYRTVEQVCHLRRNCLLMGLASDKSFYYYPETTIGQRTVRSSLFVPQGVELRVYERARELRQGLCSAADRGRCVLLLSADPQLPDHTPVPMVRINWSPYPHWVVRRFNFHHWVERSVSRYNLYLVDSSRLTPQLRAALARMQ